MKGKCSYITYSYRGKANNNSCVFLINSLNLSLDSHHFSLAPSSTTVPSTLSSNRIPGILTLAGQGQPFLTCWIPQQRVTFSLIFHRNVQASLTALWLSAELHSHVEPRVVLTRVHLVTRVASSPLPVFSTVVKVSKGLTLLITALCSTTVVPKCKLHFLHQLCSHSSELQSHSQVISEPQEYWLHLPKQFPLLFMTASLVFPLPSWLYSLQRYQNPSSGKIHLLMFSFHSALASSETYLSRTLPP